MPDLVGTPSDEVPGILETGRSDVTTVFVSMSGRHPEGRDAHYIEWHSLDHRPEQHRLSALRASLRLVSTPGCRAARMASSERYEAVDHVMSYFFADVAALDGFVDLSVGLRNAGRTPELLPLVERGVYTPSAMEAAPRIKAGADVLPWWPARGVILLVEAGESPLGALTDVAGVGGAWSVTGLNVGPPNTTTDNSGIQITYLFVDDEPEETAGRLRPALEKRWADDAVAPLLAAPFHTIVPYEWDRYLP